ncbi:hypothetical protein B6U74_05585 [Candidatus Bathyarchaeota archaeon ex4484_205]|nr:MAG: hypothetical protein B6U74_05585 [Candidatus Bathyarchaeota archaeon ex4484_205]RLG69330.1 MAG: hypothetical protein DRN93_00385 [archaeon]
MAEILEKLATLAISSMIVVAILGLVWRNITLLEDLVYKIKGGNITRGEEINTSSVLPNFLLDNERRWERWNLLKSWVEL